MAVFRNWAAYITFILSCVGAEDYNDERHKYQIATQMEHLREIPLRFEVKGENAVADFKKHINGIQTMARKNNVTVTYRIKVETLVPKPKFLKKDLMKKMKMKKYNVPLKKKNMKLSNFEIILRRRANVHNALQKNYEEQPVTTQKQQLFFSTKPAWLGKYKPIVSQVKTNYTKVVRPVRNKVITLFV